MFNTRGKDPRRKIAKQNLEKKGRKTGYD